MILVYQYVIADWIIMIFNIPLQCSQLLIQIKKWQFNRNINLNENSLNIYIYIGLEIKLRIFTIPD